MLSHQLSLLAARRAGRRYSVQDIELGVTFA